MTADSDSCVRYCYYCYYFLLLLLFNRVQVNFLSHFYLSNLIIQRQTDARTSTFADDEGEGQRSRSLRVINVASNAYSRGSMTRLFQMTSRPETGNDKDGTESVYNIYEAYADSKLAMMLFSTELNFRHTVNNVLCLATHPGTQYFSASRLCQCFNRLFSIYNDILRISF